MLLFVNGLLYFYFLNFVKIFFVTWYFLIILILSLNFEISQNHEKMYFLLSVYSIQYKTTKSAQ